MHLFLDGQLVLILNWQFGTTALFTFVATGDDIHSMSSPSAGNGTRVCTTVTGNWAGKFYASMLVFFLFLANANIRGVVRSAG